MSTVLIGTAAGLAFMHTLIGVDHTLPFVALGRAQRWSTKRTLLVTALCGVGHVSSSLVLALLGLGLGWALDLAGIDAMRGSLGSWLLIGLGSLYGVYGLVRGLHGRVHT